MKTFEELWELLTTQDESNQIEVKQGSQVDKSCWETISAFQRTRTKGRLSNPWHHRS